MPVRYWFTKIAGLTAKYVPGEDSCLEARYLILTQHIFPQNPTARKAFHQGGWTTNTFLPERSRDCTGLRHSDTGREGARLLHTSEYLEASPLGRFLPLSDKTAEEEERPGERLERRGGKGGALEE